MKFVFENHMLFVVLLAINILVPTVAVASVTATLPEPASLALLGIGLGGIGAAELIRRRRAK